MVKEQTIKSNMKHKIENKIANKWAAANFDKTLKDLVNIKYQCLHCLKYNRQKVVVESSDVFSKFRDINFKYNVVRKNIDKNRKLIGDSNKNIIPNNIRIVSPKVS